MLEIALTQPFVYAELLSFVFCAFYMLGWLAGLTTSLHEGFILFEKNKFVFHLQAYQSCEILNYSQRSLNLDTKSSRFFLLLTNRKVNLLLPSSNLRLSSFTSERMVPNSLSLLRIFIIPSLYSK
jgi:hypothetical protein